MPIVRTHCCKSIRRGVGQTFVLDTCKTLARSSESSVFNDIQPSIPPLPVDTYLVLFQFSGSHSSNVMLDRLDVGIERAMRQRFVETLWLGRPQDATLSGSLRVVFAVTYSSWVRVEFFMNFSGVKPRHCCWKVCAVTTAANTCRIRVVRACIVNSMLFNYFTLSEGPD